MRNTFKVIVHHFCTTSQTERNCKNLLSYIAKTSSCFLILFNVKLRWLETYVSSVMRCEDDRSCLLMSVQSKVFLRTAVTSEHATQHGQTLNVTHLTVVLEPVENNVKVYARWWSYYNVKKKHNSQCLQQVSPERMFGPGCPSIRVRVRIKVKTRGSGGKSPHLTEYIS